MKSFIEHLSESNDHADKIAFHKEKANWHSDKAKYHKEIVTGMEYSITYISDRLELNPRQRAFRPSLVDGNEREFARTNSDIEQRKRTASDTDNNYRDWETDRKSTRLNSSHRSLSRMPSSA